jgi:SRSO17 transposase
MTRTVLASLVPGADRQRLHHFLHDAPWDADALNRRRLELWQARPELAPHAEGVLIVDETGDRKRGHQLALAANQYLGKLGHTANGVVSVTSHWTDGTRHVPLGVRPSRPASRLPQGKADPGFQTKPELAWELIQEARAAAIPCGIVVADCISGENPKLESRQFAAGLKYILAIRPNRGTWQGVEDAANPPAFTPAAGSPARTPGPMAAHGPDRAVTARSWCTRAPSCPWGSPTARTNPCASAPPPTTPSSSRPTPPGT